MAVVPPLLGKEVFTMFFAKKTTPKAVWETDLFIRINHHLNGLWAALFFLGILSGMMPTLLGRLDPLSGVLFEGLIPAALMLAVGLPVTRYYPGYAQRKMGLKPLTEAEKGRSNIPDPQKSSRNQTGNQSQNVIFKPKEEESMNESPHITAINGSPHVGFGNTSMMIEMMRKPLSDEGFDLRVINLVEHEIEYCHGCGFCMEKGHCWIDDEHNGIVKRLLAAGGIILASPVYIFHVTAQMKTFIDRSLAYGHKPRPEWKPGLAVSVSAGLGETFTADYLCNVMRFYGAFPVGRLTAMAVSPGGFVGKDAVESRAADLARDLARAIKEKRRYPANDQDLRYYQFMGTLVKGHGEDLMKHDHKHWLECGFYDGFESYIQQPIAEGQGDRQVREAWVATLMADRREKKRSKAESPVEGSTPGPPTAKSCKELLQMMPLGFNPEAAEGLKAVYQFEIGGDEDFVAHLVIENGSCEYHDGPSASPSGVTVKSPAHVWLAISRGEMDGQQAFMNGEYTVEGDLTLLMRLKSLFSR
jgi:putative sterol carrier protein/NAD(P)H-dependent FMN reductase